MRHSAKHVTHWSYFLIDMDPVEEEANPLAAMLEAIDLLQGWTEVDLTKNMPILIDSGRGVQAWIRLDDILLDKDVDYKAGLVDASIHPSTARKINGYWLKRLDVKLGVTHGCRIDTSVSDLPRVMRCPGTVNVKTGRKAKFINYTDRTYHGLAFALAAIDEKNFVDPEIVVDVADGARWQEVFHHLTHSAQTYLTLGHEEPGRHKVIFHTLKKLREIGISQQEATRAVKRANKLRGEDEALAPSELRRIINDVYREEDE